MGTPGRAKSSLARPSTSTWRPRHGAKPSNSRIRQFQTNLPGLFVTSMAANQDFGPFFGFTIATRTSAKLISAAVIAEVTVATHRQLFVLWMNRALFCGEHRRMKWPFEVRRRLVQGRRQHLEQRIEVQHCEQRNGKGWDQEHIVQVEH